MKRILFLLFLPFFTSVTNGQGISALVVMAHPDDESMCAATIYKIAKEQKGNVDVAVITNGEAGFKYSTLAEAYYGLELTDEKTGRRYLPRIRKQELMNAGKVIGISNFYFFDQQDAKYNLDERDPLDTSWSTALVTARLREIMQRGHYDLVLCLLPEATTHAGHKAATILALRAVTAIPAAQRPVVLGVAVSNKGDQAKRFSVLKDYVETGTVSDTALFRTDRTVPFGYKRSLNYKIITNWEIAEHKSQGAFQMAMNQGDYEDFWLFKVSNEQAMNKAQELFQRLGAVPYLSKTY